MSIGIFSILVIPNHITQKESICILENFYIDKRKSFGLKIDTVSLITKKSFIQIENSSNIVG